MYGNSSYQYKHDYVNDLTKIRRLIIMDELTKLLP